MARRLIEAARVQGDQSVPGLDSMIHNCYRWERGAARPAERYRLLIRAVLGLPPPPPPVNVTAQAIPAPDNGAGTASALTVTITIALPPGTTGDITTTPARATTVPGPVPAG